MKLYILQDEKLLRNKIENEYNNYFDLYKKYYEKCHSITKCMFIDLYQQKKKYESNESDLNNLIKNLCGKVFVMCGLSEIEKRFQMIEKLLLMNLNFDFFDSNDISSPKVYIDYLNSQLDIEFSEWCFCESIKNIISEVKEEKYDKTLIIDNNACFNINTYHELKFNKEIYKNWDIIVFGDSNKISKICDLKSFAIKEKNYDKLLDNLYSNNNILEIFENVLFLNDIINSDICEKDIEIFREDDNKKYQIFLEEIIKKRDNSNDEKEKNILNNQIKFIKKNKHNNKYIYPFNKKHFNISFSYKKMIDNFRNYYEYLDNKKIALIGPSPSIRKTQNGDYIDKNYDIIVKINNAIFSDLDSYYIGKRIDVLYTLSVAQDLNQIKIDDKYECFAEYFFERINNLKIKYIVFSLDLHHKVHDNWLSLNILRFSEIYNVKNIPILFLKDSIIVEHLNNAKRIPSAGFGAILNLTQYGLKELFMKGFTFFKDGHSNSYIGKDWLKKIDKVNGETKKKLTDEKKEEIIHSLVKNTFVNISPHNFDYEYRKTICLKNIYKFINFDKSISYLFEI